MKRLAIVAMTFLGLAAGGCGSNSTTTVTVGSSSTATRPTTTLPTSTTPATVPTSTSAAAPKPSPPTVRLATFKSPSGNIGCMIIAGTARCDIRQRSWSPPPRPAGCPTQVDFGQGLIVSRHGPGRLVCAGDTSLDPSAAPLPYGTDTALGAFRCQSRTSGITCTNVNTGHGLFISIQRYRAF